LKAWDKAEKQWKSDRRLFKSKGLAEYRADIDSYRAQYQRDLLPRALQELGASLKETHAVLARLKEHRAPYSTPAIAAEVATVEARLSDWDNRAATLRTDYREVVALIREVSQMLDRLEVLEGCAGSDAAQPWCHTRESAIGPRELGSSRRLSPGAAPAIFRFDDTTTYALSNSRFVSGVNEESELGLVIREQDKSAIRGLYRRKYALLISPAYSHWEAIPDAARKLARLQEVFQQLGFEVQKPLTQALSKQDVEEAIRNFVESHAPFGGNQPNLLLVHFVGHGYTLKSGGDKFGVLLTSTTPGPAADPDTIANQAIFESFFKQFLARPLHHIVFTFETCSSGKFLEELEGVNPRDWRKCVGSPAFLVLTAGDIDEVGSLRQLPLTDEMIRTFSGCGQRREVTWSGYLLFEGIQKRLMRQFPSRNPQFRKYILDKHREGDFVLIIPDRCPVPTKGAG